MPLKELYDLDLASERISQLHASNMHVSIAATGAGLGIQDKLWAIGGASATIIDAYNPYNQAAFDRYLGHNWGESGASYSSALGATALAQRSYFGAQELSGHPALDNYNIAGLGVTAAVSTNRVRRGDNKIHAAVRTNHGLYNADVFMNKDLGRETDGVICDLVGLNLLLHAAGVEQIPIKKAAGITSEHLVETDGGYVLDPEVPTVENIDGETESVLIQPNGDVTEVNLDPQSHVIMPGSFNPMQYGHDRIAQAVRDATGKQTVLEITAKNIEKTEVDLNELALRSLQMRGRWPVILTKGNTRFIDKAAAYNGCSFAVGYDTAVRIIDPMYYPSQQAARQAMDSLSSQNITFYVAGRHGADGTFRTAQDLPPAYHHLFTSLPGNFNISSTAIRAALLTDK